MVVPEMGITPKLTDEGMIDGVIKFDFYNLLKQDFFSAKQDFYFRLNITKI